MGEYAIFVYGSLMSTDELDKMFDDYEYMKVIATDFVRDFSKRANSWGPEDEETGVMSLEREEGEKCNGLLVTGITEQELKQYSDRETGYDIEEIDSDKLTPYDKSESIPSTVLTAITNWKMDEPNTHEGYYKLCVNAASSHGQDFLEEFMKTTYHFYDEEN